MTKFTLSLESLDQRDMPSTLSLTRPPIYTESVKLEIPGGCWPGPQPSYLNGAIIDDNHTTDPAGSIIVIGSLPQKV